MAVLVRLSMAAVVAWGWVVLMGPRRAEVAAWWIGGEGRPDLGTVDGLARSQLFARRLGASILLRDACDAHPADLSQLLWPGNPLAVFGAATGPGCAEVSVRSSPRINRVANLHPSIVPIPPRAFVQQPHRAQALEASPGCNRP